MVTFKNNNNYSRRGRFRHNDRGYRRGVDNSKYKSDYSTGSHFQRKSPGRNNHNASKLIEKYNDLAREALANEDKILSENYFQHADHFMRILKEQDKNRTVKAIDEIDKNKSELIEKEDSKKSLPEDKKEDEKKVASS
jgi:hypothetical protein